MTASHFAPTYPDPEYEVLNRWADEVDDPAVVYLERLIGRRYPFSKENWCGGVTVWPVIQLSSKPHRERNHIGK
ncbi:unnamed protein product [Arabis nemorensis]|uniref:Uncharacterized protein n=1 Tax=Arabis nemorensis TaxID=586526 RepID=A0A565BZ86_9BRAS|nr:unnamed protein product [Arabis nemorensis]